MSKSVLQVAIDYFSRRAMTQKIRIKEYFGEQISAFFLLEKAENFDRSYLGDRLNLKRK